MPSVKLTRDYVRSLKPRDKRYEVYDTDTKGLVLRVYPSGRMVYGLTYARGRKVTLGRADVLTPSQAREKARAVMADFSRGTDPAEARRRAKAQTLEQYLDEVYAPWARAHHRDGDATIKRMKANFPDLLGLKLDAITPWQIEKWRSQQLKAGCRPSTVNRQLNPLKAALSRAVTWGILKENPIAAIKPVRVDASPSVRYLSDEEEARLRAALDAREQRIRTERASANVWRAERGYRLLPDLTDGYADHLKPMVILSLNIGARRGELFGLQWSDVDLPMRMLTIRGEGSKSKQTRHVPLNDEALHVLTTWRRTATGTGYVFPGEDGGRMTSIRTAWGRLLKDAGISNLRWHDLRHDFASKLAMRGTDLNVIRELLGHRDLSMTLRYSHLRPSALQDAVSRLDRKPAAEVVPIAENG